MNRENLQRMANHIRTIPKEKFNMTCYRNFPIDFYSHKCNSVGCIIGHSIILDDESNIPRIHSGEINFNEWSKNFTKLKFSEWNWCFFHLWARVDNTPEGAALRIEWLIKIGLPKNWADQMFGRANLCYLPKNSTTNE